MSFTMASITQARIRARFSASRFLRDRNAIAATEFAVIVPIMLVMFFGTVEFSSGMAVDRNVSLMARTLANLASQSQAVSAADLTVFYSASTKIMVPYVPPMYPAPNQTITELYIDPSSGNARVQWSQGTAPRSVSSIVVIPSSLIARNPTTNAINSNQYILMAEVNVLYTPTIGYVMAPAGLTLSDVAYTLPRVSTCVFYPAATVPPSPCPTS